MIVERPEGVELTELAILTGKGGEELEGVLCALEGRSLVRRLGERWFDGGAIEAAREEVLRALREGHRRRRSARGVGLEELRAVSHRPKGVIDEALRELSEQGLIRLEGSVAALAGHVPALTERQEELAASALPAIRAGGLAPPGLADLATTLGVETGELMTVLSFLVREGRIVDVTPDLFLEREALEAAARRVVERLRAGAASPSELRELLGVSRKYLIPLLEHLDAQGLTRRTPGGRVLREGG
jgi:selenocysteine-specific elongation factor